MSMPAYAACDTYFDQQYEQNNPGGGGGDGPISFGSNPGACYDYTWTTSATTSSCDMDGTNCVYSTTYQYYSANICGG